MCEIKAISAYIKQNDVIHCRIIIPCTSPWTVRLIDLFDQPIICEDRDLYESLKKLRKELEKADTYLLCNGSRIDIFPSGMSRSMGGGRDANKVKIGKQNTNVLYDIFDYTDPENIVTVEEQEKYINEWIDSLRPS